MRMRRHRLGSLLHAVPEPSEADEEADCDGCCRADGLGNRITPERGEYRSGIACGEHAGRGRDEVADQPSGDDGIVGHQNVVACNRDGAVCMPFRPLPLQRAQRKRYVLPRCPADGELHYHHGKAYHDKEGKIDKHEGRSAVLPCYVWEAPYIPQPDCASCRKEYESQAGCERFSLFHSRDSIISIAVWEPR